MTLGYNADMDEKYQLVFRGEIAEGQHRAVVKRRLGEALKLSDAQADRLFSERAVVLKKEADAKTAAALQALFKKAGARLRVRPLDASGAVKTAQVKPAQQQVQPQAAASQPAAVSPAVQAPSSDAAAGVPAERADTVAADPDSSAITLLSREANEALVAALNNQKVEFDAPDLPLAEPGADIGEPRQIEAVQLPELNFTVAETGADLLIEKTRPEPVELGELNFEVAEVGATIGDDSPKPVPPAPDISHLKIAEDA